MGRKLTQNNLSISILHTKSQRQKTTCTRLPLGLHRRIAFHVICVAMIVCECLDIHSYWAVILEDILFIHINLIENRSYKTRIPFLSDWSSRAQVILATSYFRMSSHDWVPVVTADTGPPRHGGYAECLQRTLLAALRGHLVLRGGNWNILII